MFLQLINKPMMKFKIIAIWYKLIELIQVCLKVKLLMEDKDNN